MARSRKILISGYYGFGNAGDEAILAAILQGLREHIPEIEVCVFSDNPARTTRDFGVRSVNRKNLFAMAREMLGASLLLSGGGGLIQDSTGVNTIRYYLGVVSLARKLGVPVMFYAQGAGPVRTEQGRAITRKVANRVQLITVRDDESRDLFREMGVAVPPIVVTADPVMALHPAPSERIDAIWAEEQIPRDVPQVALSIRPWPDGGAFEEAFVAVGRRLVSAHGVDVLVAPFQESQDRAICDRVAAGVGAGARSLRRTYEAPELMGLLGRMRATVGMRLHALIFSAAQGVPVVGVAYDPKVANFLRRMQAPTVALEGLDGDRLIAATEDMLRREGELRETFLRLAPALRDQALENVRLVRQLLDGDRAAA